MAPLKDATAARERRDPLPDPDNDAVSAHAFDLCDEDAVDDDARINPDFAREVFGLYYSCGGSEEKGD